MRSARVDSRHMKRIDSISRRKAARIIGGAAAGMCLQISPSAMADVDDSSKMLRRTIPSTGEQLPVIGLGTWQTFDVGLSPGEREPLKQVLQSLVSLGGSVIDSSPMYGRSEEVIGELSSELRPRLFLATKVWTRGRQTGIDSMERSFSRFRTRTIDLMQVHNLVDVSTHLQTMRDWKAAGRFRYIGVTHYNESAFSELEKVLRTEKLDFVQINYSLGEREADQRILPLAQDRGLAVLINRPFGGGDLFRGLRSKPLPEWASEFECKSWAQFLLKWVVANSAVTTAIPATNNPEHLRDNALAGVGRLPDVPTRQRMVEYVRAA